MNAAGAGFRSDDGATALDVARANNHRDLEMLLVQAGLNFRKVACSLLFQLHGVRLIVPHGQEVGVNNRFRYILEAGERPLRVLVAINQPGPDTLGQIGSAGAFPDHSQFHPEHIFQ